jgi:hypothetical protein
MNFHSYYRVLPGQEWGIGRLNLGERACGALRYSVRNVVQQGIVAIGGEEQIIP